MTVTNAIEQQHVAAAAEQAEPRYRTAKVSVPPEELRQMLDRALGTLEPSKWPQWCHDIVGGNLVRGADGQSTLYEGIESTDECTFQFRRLVVDKTAA